MVTTDRSSILAKSGGYLCCVLLLTLGWFASRQTPELSKEEKTAVIRENLIFHYLSFYTHDAGNTGTLSKWLIHLEEGTKEDPVREVLALIYALEGLEKESRGVIEKMAPSERVTMLNFALDFGQTLPEQWETMLSQDWVGARLATLIHKKLGEEVPYARALVTQRLYESEVKRQSGVKAVLQLLTYLGLGLMLSMLISARQWRRMGRNFFNLDPLFLPPGRLGRFVGFFLLALPAALGVSWILGKIPGFPDWLSFAVFYLIMTTAGFYLIYQKLFPKGTPPAHDMLGLSNLGMRFSHLFQIIGGLAVLLACFQLSMVFMISVGWRFSPDQAQAAQIKTLMEQPVSGAFFVVVTCLVAPVFEEIVFRGVIFRGLLASMRTSQAILVSACLFAVLHGLDGIPIYLALGCGLALIYYRTGNILVNTWAHALWNLMVLMLTVTGIHLS